MFVHIRPEGHSMYGATREEQEKKKKDLEDLKVGIEILLLKLYK